MAASAYLSLQPAGSGPEIHIWDKALHFFGYFVLMLLCELAFKPGHQIVLKLVLVVLYGLLIEGLQYFVPGREVSLLDALANLSGIVSAVLIMALLRKLAWGQYPGLNSDD